MSKIPIVMPTYNRPQYLKVVLEYLSRNENLDKFFILTSEEPDQPKVAELFDGINFVEVKRNVNSVRLGCNGNILHAVNLGFDISDRVVVLEDDVVPGRDFLNFFLWGFEEAPKLDWNIGTISGYCADNDTESPIDSVTINARHEHCFSSLGWGTWKHIWKNFVFKERVPYVSWDIVFQDTYLRPGGFVRMHPSVGRSNHIGEEGTHSRKGDKFICCSEWVETRNQNPIRIFKFEKRSMSDYNSRLVKRYVSILKKRGISYVPWPR